MIGKRSLSVSRLCTRSNMAVVLTKGSGSAAVPLLLASAMPFVASYRKMDLCARLAIACSDFRRCVVRREIEAAFLVRTLELSFPGAANGLERTASRPGIRRLGRLHLDRTPRLPVNRGLETAAVALR